MFNLSRVVHRDELFDMLSRDTTLSEKLSCTVRSGTWDDVRTVLTAVKEPAIRVKPMSTWKDLESGSSDR